MNKAVHFANSGINLFDVIHGMHFFLPLLESNPEGVHIPDTASAMAFSPPPMMSPYVTSKFAIVGLTEAFNQRHPQSKIDKE